MLKCRYGCDEEFEDKVDLMNHYKDIHPKEKNVELEPETSYSPMAAELEGVLRSWLSSSKDKRRIAQICSIADRSAAMVFSSPDALRSFLSKFALTSDLLEAATLQLFGFQPTQQSPGQPYPPQYGPGGYLPPQSCSDGGITHADLERRLQDQERRFQDMVAGAIETALRSAIGEKSERERWERETELKVNQAQRDAELKSQVERLTDEIKSQRNGNPTENPIVLEKINSLQERFFELQRESQYERKLESELLPLREQVAALVQGMTPSRQPSEYEVKSQNLSIVAERVGLSLDKLTDLVSQVGVPVAMNQMTSQLRQQGIPDEEIPNVLKALMQHQTAQTPRQKVATSGLQAKIAAAESKWMRNSPRPVVQEAPTQAAADPESRWPGAIIRSEVPQQQLVE